MFPQEISENISHYPCNGGKLRVEVQPTDQTLDLSVVIPAMNEAPNLYRLIPLLRDTLDSMNITWEILVIDKDSPDGTQAVVSHAGARYVLEERSGYGTAILRGVAEARGEYVLTMDADLSHPTAFIQSLWAARNEAEIVIASRYVPGGYADQPAFRYFLSCVLNRFFGIGLSIPVKDMSSGFRLYRKSLFANMDLTFRNFVILVEILLRTYAKGLRVKEVGFHYQPRGSGASKARIIKFGKDYLRLFYRIWRIRNSVQFPDYDWRAFDSRIPLQRYWQRKRHAILTGFTPPFVSTCDVGCGSSRTLADLPHAVGVDLRHDKLAFMRRTNDKLVQSDGLKLPFGDATFECVICSQVIEHIPDESGRLIDELTRILRPGGTLILGTPDYGNWEWIWTERLYHLFAPNAYADEHVTRYTYASLSKALTERGYRQIEHAYILRGELIFKAVKAE